MIKKPPHPEQKGKSLHRQAAKAKGDPSFKKRARN